MQASTVKIQEVFLSNLVLKIPYFQRSYVWKKKIGSVFYKICLIFLKHKKIIS